MRGVMLRTHSIAVLGVAFGVLVGLLTPAQARTWRIRADGNGDAPTIQAGIDSAATRDTVLVATGTYYETPDTHDKELILRGEAGPECTIIDGGQGDRVLLLGAGGIVEGLTLRNGVTPAQGGGIAVVQGHVLIRSCIIENNVSGLTFEAGSGGGVSISAFVESAILEDNIIRNNRTNNVGGGIRAGTVELHNNVIAGNHAVNSGGGLSVTLGRMTGNLVVGNTTDHAAAGVEVTFGEMRNNTIVGNLIAQPSGFCNMIWFAQVSNNIFAFNGSAFAFPEARSGVGLWALECSFLCNDLWGNDVNEIGGSGNTGSNFSDDPLFCNAAAGDYHLDRRSPCLSCSGLVGAFEAACGGTPVANASWSHVKNLYR